MKRCSMLYVYKGSNIFESININNFSVIRTDSVYVTNKIRNAV